MDSSLDFGGLKAQVVKKTYRHFCTHCNKETPHENAYPEREFHVTNLFCKRCGNCVVVDVNGMEVRSS